MCRWLRVRGYSQRKECYASVSTCTRVYSEEGVLCVGGYVYEGIVRGRSVMRRCLRVRGYSQRKECYASVATCTRV